MRNHADFSQRGESLRDFWLGQIAPQYNFPTAKYCVGAGGVGDAKYPSKAASHLRRLKVGQKLAVEYQVKRFQLAASRGIELLSSIERVAFQRLI